LAHKDFIIATEGTCLAAASARRAEFTEFWIKQRPGVGPAAAGEDRQYGWYVEPSFKIIPSLGVFARYNVWDNQAGDANTSLTRKTQTDIGVNYWPHENVVVKFDVMDQGESANDKGFNLGVGYMF
jgi:hypothetical protein